MAVPIEEIEAGLALAGVPVEQLRLMLELAERLVASDPLRAVTIADDALALAKKADDKLACARAAYYGGYAFHYQGDYAEALARLQHAAHLAEEADHTEWRGMTLRGIGIVYDATGLYEIALEHFVRALALFREVGNEDRERLAMNSIAIIYSRTDRREEAVNQYRQLAQKFAEADQPTDLACVLCNLGIDLGKLGRADEALPALDRAEQILLNAQVPSLLAVVRANRAHTLSRLDRDAEALPVLREVLPALVKHKLRASEVDTRVQIGQLLTRQGNHGEAEIELLMALEMAEERTLQEFAIEAMRALSDLYKRQGRFELALEYFDRYHTADKALFNERSDRKLKVLQVDVDLQRMQQEAALQRLQHTELALAHDELQRASRALFEADRAKSKLLMQLEQQSITDPLTGIHNRRYLDRQLALEFERAQRYGHALTVAVCDIDHFKQINDRFSHAIGDETIKAIAQLLRNHVRQSDIVARFGGEEFVLVFAEQGVHEAYAACEKIRHAIQVHPWQAIHPELKVTISIGLAPFEAHCNHEKMLSAADRCLYAAKHGGRNQVCVEVPVH